MASTIYSIYNMVQGIDFSHLQTPMALPKLVWIAILGRVAFGTVTNPSTLDACPGYKVEHVSTSGSSISADLVLAGSACNVFGADVSKLKLDVTYETSMHSTLTALGSKGHTHALDDYQSLEFMSRLQIHLPNDTRSPTLYFLDPRRTILVFPTIRTYSLTTPILHSRSRYTGLPPLRFYSRRRLTLLYLNPSIFE